MRQQILGPMQARHTNQLESDRLHRPAINPIPADHALPKLSEASSGPEAYRESRFNHDFSRTPLHAPERPQRAAACPLSPTRCPFGGACHSCPVAVQAKLTIGQPNDKYEQEADRVAEQVMSMPEPRIQRQEESEEEEEEEPETIRPKPVAEQITPLAQRQVEPEEEEEIQPKAADDTSLQRQEEEPEEEEEEETASIQTKRVGGPTSRVGPRLAAQIGSLRGGGQPLPQPVRAFFESRFGYDFGQVRVHTDRQAAETAQAVKARAFTVGRDVVFGPDQYAPRTSKGRRVLAHELTHVLQQRRQPFGDGLLQRLGACYGNMPPQPGIDPEDPFNCERLVRIEGVTSCTSECYFLNDDVQICIGGICPGHPDYDPRRHPDYRPEGDEAEILVKYPCYSRRNCTGRKYAKYTHCHNCRNRASGKSLLKPTGCEVC